MKVDELVTKADIAALEERLLKQLKSMSVVEPMDVQLDIAEVRRLLGDVHHDTVLGYIRKGLLKPTTYDTRRYKVKLSEVQRFMKEKVGCKRRVG